MVSLNRYHHTEETEYINKIPIQLGLMFRVLLGIEKVIDYNEFIKYIKKVDYKFVIDGANIEDLNRC